MLSRFCLWLSSVDYDVCRSWSSLFQVYSKVYSTWSLFNLLDMYINVFLIKIWEIVGNYFFKCIFTPFLFSFKYSLCAYISTLDNIPQVSEALFLFYFLFLVHCSVPIINHYLLNEWMTAWSIVDVGKRGEWHEMKLEGEVGACSPHFRLWSLSLG